MSFPDCQSPSRQSKHGTKRSPIRTLMRLISCLFVLTLALGARAATPSAAQLLPADTLVLFSVPDWDKAVSYWQSSAYGKLWQDPALKDFREKLVEHWQKEWAAPLERQLGVKIADYFRLPHGQLTFAITQNGWGTRPEAKPGIILLVDCRDKQEALKAGLAELNKKWVEGGKTLKTDKIRGVEFTTLILTDRQLDQALGKAAPPPAEESVGDEPAAKPDAPTGAERIEITFGQTGSLLILGNNARDIESILARQSGGLAPALADQPAYEASHAVLFGDALALAWADFAKIYQTLEKQANSPAKPAPTDNPFVLPNDRILAASGLGALRTVAARLSGNAEGPSAEIFLRAPEAERQGILRLLSLEKKDASPPPFVGADVVRFKRWRMDGQQAWTTLENMLTSISPQVAGLLQMGLQAAGKDRDPNFDLKKTLLGSLGDDFLLLQKPPKSSSLRDLSAPPSLLLIGSPNPENLVQAMRAGTGLMPLAGGEADLKEREFLGRKIYSLALPALGGPGEPRAPASSRQFNFAASAGYAAMSTDVSLVEEYLRSTENPGRSMRDTPGLAEAAQKVGGMGAGLFGYQNQAEVVRIWLESARKESAALDKLLSLAPLAGSKVMSPEEKRKMEDWLDASALPPFDKIAKYFHFIVYSFGSSDEGLSWRLFAPAPPQRP
jgi:hypothetical protein